jgi:acyl-CoA reductase-like NAD-dependent aldehyde dehydrogenase
VLQAAVRTIPKSGVLDIKLFIDGKYVDAIGGKTFDAVNPATGEVIARVAEADYDDVDLAVRAARKAFDERPWPHMPVAERSAILKKFAAGIRAREQELSELESLDTGKPIRESSMLDIPRSAYNIEFFAELVKCEIANEAGLPRGVLNIVQGFGPDAAGSAITEHPDVDCLSFTGETTTGKAIMKAASEHLKEVSMELGGKAAALVFADADLDLAIAQLTRSRFLNQGEVCLASPRLLVQRPIFDEFCTRFQRAAEALVFGDLLDMKTSIGSLIDKEHYDRVAGYIEIAKAEGARLSLEFYSELKNVCIAL